MNKKDLSERDICTKYITPAITNAGWMQKQIREEVSLTDGRVMVRGNLAVRVKNPKSKGGPKRADFVLYAKPNVPLAIVEAKSNKYSVGHGMQQALAYAEMLDVPFAFSSSGDSFLMHDRTGLTGRALKKYLITLPSLAEQQRIVAKVDELMTPCDQLKSRLSESQQTQLHLSDAIVEQAVM